MNLSRLMILGLLAERGPMHGHQIRRAGELGLEVGIDSTRGDFAQDVLAYTGGSGADVILDLIGGPAWEANLKALAVRGRLVVKIA